MKTIALVPAAGVGSRFGASLPKQYTEIAGQTVLAHTVAALLAAQGIDEVAIVVAPDDTWIDAMNLAAHPSARVSIWRVGGASRAESVRNGVAALLAQNRLQAEDWVAVHDAARCCVSGLALERLLVAAWADEVGAILAIPVADTLKQEDGKQRIDKTVSRAGLWQAQTPQMFRAGLLVQALAGDLAAITDEASAIEALGLSPRLVLGEATNLKLTQPEDARLAEYLLKG